MTPAPTGPEDQTSDGPSRSGAPSIGPLAVEAALLLDVVADRLTAMRPPTTGGGPDPDRDPRSPSEWPSESESESESPSESESESPSESPSPWTSTRAAPGAGPDGRCPECGSIPGSLSGAACTACPLCRFLAVIRGDRPEATAKLLDGALLIVRTLRSLLPEPDPAAASTGSPGEPNGSAGSRHGGAPGDRRGAEPPTGPPRRPGGLEHIDIG